jgi:glycosyltransferase involved in cell wall biosynthesis
MTTSRHAARALRQDRKPHVSVITIFLDEERFLAEAVESVLAQAYDSWELLLCDDGSTDGSTAIAVDFAERYPDRIRYLSHPGHENRGMSATRNLGLAHCRGELIAFLDADDVWLPEKLDREVAALAQHPTAGMVVGPALYWHSWTGAAADLAFDERSRVGAPAGKVTRGATVLSRILRGSADPLCTCSVLVRREVVAGVRGFEDRFHGLFEDQAFFAKVLLDHDVFATADCLARYRQHADSCCGRAIRATPVLEARRTEFLAWLSGYSRSHPRRSLLLRFLTRERWLQRYSRLGQARLRARDRRRAAYGRLVGAAYALARLTIPAAARSWLHDRLGAHRGQPPAYRDSEASGRTGGR